MDRVRFNCQVWGGSGTVFVPVEGDTNSDAYRAELIRSDVDRSDGMLLGESFEAPRWIDRGFARARSRIVGRAGAGSSGAIGDGTREGSLGQVERL